MEHELDPDFATVMQELSAQATPGPGSGAEESTLTKGTTPQLFRALQVLSGQIDGLQNSLTKKIEALDSAHSSAAITASRQFRKLEEQISELKSTEALNQKLFDTLHQELLSYRDNFARESLQKPVIRDLLVLFDDLTATLGQLEQSAGQSGSTQAGNNLRNSLHFLVEILHRLEVNEIETEERVDRTLHRVISFEPTQIPEEDGLIISRLKRGFTWRGKVLRAEEVIARRFQ